MNLILGGCTILHFASRIRSDDQEELRGPQMWMIDGSTNINK